MSAQPTEGRPPEWDRMPWAARQRWEARQRQARREEQPEQPATQRPAPPDGIPRDEKGRRIWTRQEQLAAINARSRWKTSAGTPLTDDQVDACRQYDRERSTRRRTGRSRPQRPVHETVALIEEMQACGRSTDEICQALQRSPETVARVMDRAGRHDLSRPFRALHLSRRRVGGSPNRPSADRATLPERDA